jgi:tetratricopeptide (TPR) repeat protein
MGMKNLMPTFPVDLLQTFEGYLSLRMFADTHEQLERMSIEFKTHPKTLHARLILLVEMERWEDGVILGTSLIKLWPDYSDFHLKTAYCLHELRHTDEAKKMLINGPPSLRDLAVFHYNLACYEAQLGNILEAKEHLGKCFKIDKDFRLDSLDDSDLKPLWDSLKT